MRPGWQLGRNQFRADRGFFEVRCKGGSEIETPAESLGSDDHSVKLSACAKADRLTGIFRELDVGLQGSSALILLLGRIRNASAAVLLDPDGCLFLVCNACG